MKIAPNSVVTLSYKLHAGLPDEDMQHVESTPDDRPFQFLFGSGGIIAGFEKNVSGLQPGDHFNFKIEPEDAYGTADEKAIFNLPLDIFRVNGNLDMDALKVDNILPLRDNEGNQMNGRVVSFDDQNVLMDFNHPLAGHALRFEGKILEVREASAEELSHGHVH